MGDNTIKFADLFAGIGGFHLAVSKFAKEKNKKSLPVVVSENDLDAQLVYKKNFHTDICGDIRTLNPTDFPDFDILFAGFPCQPFSKGGKREGFADDTRGTLFFDVVRFLQEKKPKYFLLENVSNLVSHDNGNTYAIITGALRELGYSIPDKPLVISPVSIGIPSLRSRVYIPGVLQHDNQEFDFSKIYSIFQNNNKNDLSIYTIISNDPVDEKYYISDYEKNVLDMWDEFYQGIEQKVIGFPVWSEEFGVDYDYSDLPRWKQNFIQKNRDLYNANKQFLDLWLKKYIGFTELKKTHKKFEWQAGTHCHSVYDGLIQFRPSGIRVKRPNYFSTLVAMNHSQIVGPLKRRLSPQETQRLQSFPRNFMLHPDDRVALKQLGNAVNVEVVYNIIKFIFEHDES
ncbi:MAG: (cytosine-5)-methyltransferase 1 [Patescibacteria group bacterium]|nr:(cytosine-5)-methyltransferase 1 [Patescibacteria group bacterium]